MSNKEYTAIDIIVDRSGSMQSIVKDANGGIAQFLKEQAELPGKCTVRIDQFDTQFETAVPSTDVKDVKYSLNPRGGTALLDALGNSITQFAEEIKRMPKDERPRNKIVVVVTDGGENSSREWTREEVFKLISDKQGKKHWEFVFLAANQDAIKVGATYGFAQGQSMTYAATSAGMTNTYSSLSSNVSALRSGAVGSINFSEADRDAATEK